MTSIETKRGAKEGIAFGVVAGIPMALAQVAAAVAMGDSPWFPFRMIASLVFGRHAFTGMSLGGAILVALIVHFALSAAFGLAYGLLNTQLSTLNQTQWSRQIGIGLLFGAAVWFLNYQVVARAMYPWFLTQPQALQLLLHALFFGVPLGLMYARAERRVHGIREVPLT